MGKFLLLFTLLFCPPFLVAQEICDNGLDDNGNGLADLNDPACACQGIPYFGEITSIIPNPSLDNYTCCPSGLGELSCADPWYTPNAAGPSVYNQCGYVYPGLSQLGLDPFPDGPGAGSISVSYAARQYLAVCLDEPLVAGNTYNLSFSIAYYLLYNNPPWNCPSGNPLPSPLQMVVYAHPDCNPPPSSFTNCLSIPTSSQWVVIGNAIYNPLSSWQPLTITCSPTANYQTIAIGAACIIPNEYQPFECYSSLFGGHSFMLDDFSLQVSGSMGNENLSITQSGSFCQGNLTLSALLLPETGANLAGGSWQWYYEGVAIPGQTGEQLLIAGSAFQPGLYTVRFQLGGNCITASTDVQWVTPPPGSQTSFICPGETTVCAGQSFNTTGSFDVTLTAASGCDSIVTCNIQLYPVPPPTILDFTECAPFAIQACDEIITETGTYQVTCPSSLGCDSIVLLNLTVLDPLAFFLQPDTLSCDTTDQVLLDGSLSPPPADPSVLMTFEWTGPPGGISGPANGPVAQAVKEGAYCLDVIFSKNGQSCTDTRCWTVSRNGGAPCLALPPPDCVLENCCCGTPVEVGVPNGNFEEPQTGVDIVTFFAGENFGGWNVVSGDVDLLGPNYLNWATGNPNGASQFIDLHGFNPGTISTTLTGMTPGATYTIVIWYAKNAGAPSGTCNITVAGGAWLNETWTATNNGANGWLETCFSFVAQAPTATLQLAGSGPFNLGGMLIDDITMWSCPTDTEPPVAVNPPATSLLLDCTEPLPPSSLLATDNCSPSVEIDFSETTIPNFCFFTLERTWTLSDDCGNTTTLEQTITVTDDEPPVLVTPPADLTVDCNANFLAAFNAWIANNGGALASDNCDNDLTWQAVFSQPPNGNCGQTSVIFTVSDDCGNLLSTEATFTIADSQPPMLILPAQNISLPCSADPETAFDGWLSGNGFASAGDPCDPVTWTNDYPGGPPAPNNVVTFTATDRCGNSVETVGIFSIENTADTTLVASTTCDPGLAGVFTQNLTGADGCDSTVIETVALLAGDSVAVFETSCDPASVGVFTQNLINQNGCDSTVVTTVAFAESDTTLLASTTCDPTGVGVFTEILTNSAGCDSVVIETVALLAGDSVAVFETSCDPASVGVFTQNLINQNGCDSTVVTTVAFAESDTTLLASATCDPSLAGVFTQNLTGADGCDSILIETVALLPSDSVAVFETSCDPAQTGVFTEIFSNQNGCDSVVVTTVAFAESDTTLLASATCDPSAAGVFTQNLTGANGCDSVVIETVALLAGDSVAVFETSCDPAQTGIFSEILTNQNGCDSVVVTTVAFAESDTTLLASTTCDPSLAGVFTQNLTGADGCDSVVIETVALLPSDSVAVFETSCDPAQTGIFSEILTNQNGCDSVVVTTVAFAESDTTLLASTTCDPSLAGVFTQNLTGADGCDSVVVETVALLAGDSVAVFETSCDPAQTVVFTEIFSNQNGCDSVVFTTVSLLAGDTVFLSSTTCDPDSAGVFEAVFTNQNGCDSTVVTEILWSPPPVLSLTQTDFNGFGVGCDGGSDGAIGAAVSGEGPFVFLWSNGGTGPSLEGLAAGAYGLTVTDAAGCTATAEAELTEPEPLEVALAVNAPDCFGQDAGAVFVEPAGGVLPYLFALDGGAFRPENSFDGLPAGTYGITVQDANGCEVSEIIWIDAPLPVDVELGENQEVALGGTATLTALVNVPFESLASVVWSPLDSAECPGCLTQPVAPLVTTAYSVTVTAANGCRDEDGVTVFVDRRRQVFVPNAFSPNGDGVNDVLTVFAKPGTVKTVRSFLVFSRWGESVFELFNFQPNDPALGWDGTHRGEELDPAVFVWFAEVEFVDGEVGVFEGGVTVVR